jgi:peptide/nickel transport system substrate-binding protein
MFLRSSRRRGSAAAIGILAVALAAGCSGSSGGSGTSAKSGGGAEADTLIAYTGQSGDYQINFNPFSPTQIGGPGTIFEPLFFFDQVKNIDPVPLLGTKYSWNADGTVLSITTREGVKWSDGVPFTAKDVVFTLDMITKNQAMNTAGYKGSAVAPDDTHVVITFPTPAYMDGPQLLGKTFVVPEHIWSKIATPATDAIEKPIGTGPYTLSDFKPQAYTLTANPGYWGGEPALKNVRYLSLSGNQAGADALAAGQIDWQTGPVPDIANVSKNYPGYDAITVPLNQMALFTCSNADLGCKGPQTDPAVRQAIYYGMDRTQLNALAFEKTASDMSPGLALMPRDEAFVSSKLTEKTAPTGPEAAKATKLLEGAGWAKGSDGIYAKDGQRLAMTVKVVSGWTDYITAVDTMSQQLKAIGIEITAQQVSWNEWSDARGQGQFELLIDSLNGGPAADPYYLYEFFLASENTVPVGKSAYPNYARFSDPQVDTALASLKAINPTDSKARQPFFDVIQTQVEKSMPYIPIMTGGTTSEFHSSKFTGWPTKDDLYAFPAIWSRPDDARIFVTLKPTGK